ncbi:indolepyruvate ferredoxin oxidoreductase, alpha subunit [Methanobacterium lacus]|uniref:Indolepyruvate oxidoreductase subunit IorA n=1 Tax=Methanobacterium lacus (strain AL-21) TaxID=877455 RepID=F0TAG5_METLA|nr:indolepyruvate ferredoxin oxidoreductase subunit alpha [Methanobacterium lacus]ADZ08917.1 indolepyruvate ferredoxin oxidoreductase, alpha subunit [Methanobacterium lacus]
MNLKEVLTAEENQKLFLLGNEAAVRGALEAGVGLASTYPGTPSSEIGDVFSKLAEDAGIYFEFSTNEKVALEVAASAAASGVRSFTFMKHVGVNVASDSLMSAVYTGVEGGMVILSADDPSMFSSQNEQDNRHYARLANMPMVEPSNPEEIRQLMGFSFELSEQFKLPVLMRTTTRVSHMRGVVETGKLKPGKTKGFFKRDPQRFVPVPATAMIMHKNLVRKMEELRKLSNSSELNKIYRRNGKVGVVTSGGAFNYVMDAVQKNDLNVDVFKVTLTHPFPDELLLEFIKDLDAVAVVEEVDPIMEKEVLSILGRNGIKMAVHGKLDQTLPMIYEYTPNIVMEMLETVLNQQIPKNQASNSDLSIPERPPTLCPGCPHRSVYYTVKDAVNSLGLNDVIYPTDIGCYTLGITSPYDAADYLLSMGSSIGTSCGFSKATKQNVVCFIGDSTFFHAGIPPLINAVHNKDRFVLVILDNRTTAMTGGQPHPGLPVDGMGWEAPEVSIDAIVEATGVKYLRKINPMNIKKSKETFMEALEFDGVAVVISQHPCMLTKGRRSSKAELEVKQEKCDECAVCLEKLACTAIYKDDEGKVRIDPKLCNGCNVCVQVCPERAIGVKK